MTNPARKRLLIVAGHDPSGAGIDADREAVGELPIETLAVVTAWTDQDARGVRSIGARAADEWVEEALAHARRGVDAVKIGLLPGERHVLAAARLVRGLHAISGIDLPIVLDPVIAASSGARFLDARAVEVLRAELIPTGVIVTPNLVEAAELARVPFAPLVGEVEHGGRPGSIEDAGHDVARRIGGARAAPEVPHAGDAAPSDHACHERRGDDADDEGSATTAAYAGFTAARLEAARILLALGARAVIVKGGHGAESPVRDLVATSAGLVRWSSHARIAGGKVRGSGCRFASRLAARLALGSSLSAAAEDAGRHVRAAIAALRTRSGSP